MSAKETQTGAGRSSFARRFRRRFIEPAALRRLLRRAQPLRVAAPPEPDGFGRAEIGRRLVSGRFQFAGTEIVAAPRELWAVAGRQAADDLAWRIAAHRFDWLDDLAALGGSAARAATRQAIEAWIAAHGQAHDALVWRPDIAGRRLHAFLRSAALARAPSAAAKADAFDAAFGRALHAHAEWTLRTLAAPPPGPDRLTNAVALALGALVLEGWPSDRAAIETALDATIDGAIGPDGAAVDRSPVSTWRAFALLTSYRAQAEALGVGVSDVVAEAIARLGPAVRFFRAADGGLALFHGTDETSDGRIDVALAGVRAARSPARRLADAGFERLTGGRVSVLFDAGAPRGEAASMVGHASTLAIEVCAGRRRLIVNCGSGATLDAEWARACRGAPAHSTLTIDGQDFVTRETVDSDVGLVSLCHGPSGVAVERKEERNGAWLMASHDGYRSDLGLRMTRRLFLSADGGDFRGEDTALAVGADGRKLLEKRLAQRERQRGGVRIGDVDASRGLPVRARFHLHPDVAAAIVADGEAVTLRLPHGEVWVMRQAGGALALEDSVYLGRGGDPEPTQQVVVTAHARQERTQLRWAFRRVGELSQLPKDVEALLAETSLRADRPSGEPSAAEPAPIDATSVRPAR